MAKSEESHHAQSGRYNVTQRRIGIFGGTFDPPHLGHLIVADQVRDTLNLGEVWLVVANDPWQKSGSREITPAAKRLEMLEAALDGAPGLRASDVELEEPGPSYSFDTLSMLQQRMPDVAWSLIVGRDAAVGLPTWHRADELKEMAEIIVVNRPGSSEPLPDGWKLTMVDMPALEISSTDLRHRLATGASVRYLMPDPVINLATAWGIYRPSE